MPPPLTFTYLAGSPSRTLPNINRMTPPAKQPFTPKAHRYRDPAPYHHSHPLRNSDDRKEYKILQRKEIYNTSPTLAVLPKDVGPKGGKDGKPEKPGKMKSKLQGQLEIARKIDERKERRRNKVKWLHRFRKSTRMQADREPVKTKEGADVSGEFLGKKVDRNLFPQDDQPQVGVKSKQRPRARVGSDIFTTSKAKDIPPMSPRERGKEGKRGPI